jgi:uncharacterized membrane protein YesL
MFAPFFRAFKSKFVRATCAWGVLVVLLAIFALDLYYYLWVRPATVSSAVMAGVQVVLLGCVLTVFVYVFAETIDSPEGVGASILDGARLAAKHWLASLGILVVTIGIPGVLIWLKLWQFAIFTFGAMAYANTRIMVRAARPPASRQAASHHARWLSEWWTRRGIQA